MASCAAKILRVKPTRIISFGLLHEPLSLDKQERLFPTAVRDKH
jgi:hypothetical protein